MKVRITFEFDNSTRRALNVYHGQPGMADRDSIKGYIIGIVNTSLDDLPDPDTDNEH